MAIDWHYPRKELTETVLAAYDTGASRTFTLFAPRRMGKTQFVIHDLMPAAGKRGYQPIYVSFWENPDNPTATLANAVKRTIMDAGWFQRYLKHRLSGFSIGAEVDATGSIGANIGIQLDQPREPSAEELGQLKALFQQATDLYPDILLCLDEVQHLATDKAFKNLVYFLRTLLDENPGIRVMYTGSNRDGLRQLFKKRKAPLFQSTSQIDLPDLGAGFINHIRSAFEQATGRSIGYQDAMSAFFELNRVPRDFRSVIDALILSGDTDIKATTQRYRLEQMEDNDYQSTWDKLKPLDRALLQWIASGDEGLYQENTKAFLAGRIGTEADAIANHTIQNALKRLRGDILWQIDQGVWDFEDAAFKSWITEHTDLPGD